MSRRGLVVAALVGTALCAVPATAGATSGAQTGQLQDAGPLVGAALWISRLLNYLSLAAVTGFLLAAGWLTPWARRARLGPTAQRAARVAAMSAGVWVLSGVGLFVFGLANAAAVPVGDALDAGMLGRFAQTRFGAAVAVQTALAGCTALIAAAATTTTTARAALAVTGLAALGPPWWGHAGSADVPAVAVLNDWLHVLAASAWAGGLAALSTLLLLGRAREAAGTDPGVDVPRPSRRFSRFAGWALAAVLATGVVNTVLHTGHVRLLLDTSWGRFALVKVALLGVIGALAWWNRTRMLARLRAAGGRTSFARVALAELGVMVIAFGAATSMASGAPPDVEVAARVASVTVPFAEGSANLTIDQGTTGGNEVHLYFFGPDGGLQAVEAAAVTLRRDGDAVAVPLVDAGPGHYVGPHVELPDAGAWDVEVTATVEGETVSATTTVTIR